MAWSGNRDRMQKGRTIGDVTISNNPTALTTLNQSFSFPISKPWTSNDYSIEPIPFVLSNSLASLIVLTTPPPLSLTLSRPFNFFMQVPFTEGKLPCPLSKREQWDLRKAPRENVVAHYCVTIGQTCRWIWLVERGREVGECFWNDEDAINRVNVPSQYGSLTGPPAFPMISPAHPYVSFPWRGLRRSWGHGGQRGKKRI